MGLQIRLVGLVRIRSTPSTLHCMLLVKLTRSGSRVARAPPSRRGSESHLPSASQIPHALSEGCSSNEIPGMLTRRLPEPYKSLTKRIFVGLAGLTRLTLSASSILSIQALLATLFILGLFVQQTWACGKLNSIPALQLPNGIIKHLLIAHAQMSVPACQTSTSMLLRSSIKPCKPSEICTVIMLNANRLQGAGPSLPAIACRLSGL